MRAPLLLLLAALASAAWSTERDADDDSVPVLSPTPAALVVTSASPVTVATVPDPSTQGTRPVYPASTAPHSAPATGPAPIIDSIRDGYPESAHAAFEARATFEVYLKAHRPAPGTAMVTMGATPMSRLQMAAIDAEVTSLNNWFSDPTHLPTIAQNDTAHHDLWCLVETARREIGAHHWPCWTMASSTAGTVTRMGCLIGRLQGPDWLTDLTEATRNGTHRTK